MRKYSTYVYGTCALFIKKEGQFVRTDEKESLRFARYFPGCRGESSVHLRYSAIECSMLYAVLALLLLLFALVLYTSRLVGGWASVLGKRVPLPPLHGRVYVVTGGGRGVGFQVAARLAEAGATVVLTSRSAESGEAAARAIGPWPLRKVVLMTLDLASPGSVTSFARECLERFGHLDGLLLNGGIAQSFLDSDGFHVPPRVPNHDFGAAAVHGPIV